MAVMFEWHVRMHFCCMLQAKDMNEEREGLLQDIAKLKAALQQLAARHQGMLYTYPYGEALIHVAHASPAQTGRLYHVCTAMPNIKQAGCSPCCWHALQSHHDCNCVFLGVGECCLHPNGMLLYECCCIAQHKHTKLHKIPHTTQHNTTQHNTTQHNTTQHNTTQHNTTQHNTTLHNKTHTTQHNTAQHKAAVC